MLARLSRRLLAASRSSSTFVAFGVAAFVSFQLLRLTGRAFQKVTHGHAPLDFQNGLTAPDLRAQLLTYTPASRRLYRVFFVLDLVFPTVAATFQALAWARLLKRPGTFAARVLKRHALLWPYLSALFDFAENIAFLLLSERRARPEGPAAFLGVTFKRLKLGALSASAFMTALLIVARLAPGAGVGGVARGE